MCGQMCWALARAQRTFAGGVQRTRQQSHRRPEIGRPDSAPDNINSITVFWPNLPPSQSTTTRADTTLFRHIDRSNSSKTPATGALS